MTHTIELGQCLLRDILSQLQLDFTATANLNQRAASSGLVSASTLLLPDLVSAWIKEAPEIEMRLFVRFGSGLEHIPSQFIPKLEERLCVSSVWSELGFTATCKSHDSHGILNYPERRCIVLGLCRHTLKTSFTKTRCSSVALRNASDIPPPQDVPTISLSAIEVYLEYNRFFQEVDNYDQLGIGFRPNELYPIAPSFSTPATDLMTELQLTPCMPFNYFMDDHYPSLEHTVDQSFQSFFELIDFGLQKMIVSPFPKIPHILVHGEDTLQNLRKLAPGIFNREYREAMNQRAASIPIVTKALTSMLSNTSNPKLQQHMSTLPEDRKAWITDTLWRKTQAQLHKPRVPKNRCRFFPPNPTNGQSHAIADIGAMELYIEDIFSEGDILDMEVDWGMDFDENKEYNDFLEFIHTDIDEESDGQIFGSGSESSFTDLYESTQTTQATEDLDISYETVSSPLTETEMLLCDCDLG